jgi:hypothetical protein
VVALAADRRSECEVQAGPEAVGRPMGGHEERKASGTPTAAFETDPTLPGAPSLVLPCPPSGRGLNRSVVVWTWKVQIDVYTRI